MTVAVAYVMSAAGRLALQEAVEEARLRGEDLAVIHVVGSLDAHKVDTYRQGISAEVTKAVASADVKWRLHMRVAASDADVNGVLLDLIEELGVGRVVIGARKRSPLGKALLGSTAQTVVLGVNVPVLVVKAPAH